MLLQRPDVFQGLVTLAAGQTLVGVGHVHGHVGFVVVRYRPEQGIVGPAKRILPLNQL